MITTILGFIWAILKGMAFLGGVLVFFAFLGSFCKILHKMSRQKKELEKRMQKAWNGDGDKSKKKRKGD